MQVAHVRFFIATIVKNNGKTNTNNEILKGLCFQQNLRMQVQDTLFIFPTAN